jgi:hypothetical protein
MIGERKGERGKIRENRGMGKKEKGKRGKRKKKK